MAQQQPLGGPKADTPVTGADVPVADVPVADVSVADVTGADVAATYCATLIDEWVRLGLHGTSRSAGCTRSRSCTS